MTGEKNPRKPLLSDDELTTPEHDKMVMEVSEWPYLVRHVPELREMIESGWLIYVDRGNAFFKTINNFWEKVKEGELASDEWETNQNLRSEFGAWQSPLKLEKQLQEYRTELFKEETEKTPSPWEIQRIKKDISRIEEAQQQYPAGKQRMQDAWKKLVADFLDCSHEETVLADFVCDLKSGAIKLEAGIYDNIGRPIGFWDVVVTPKELVIMDSHGPFSKRLGKQWKGECSVYIEVKPKIRSCGELLRQLELYQRHTHRGTKQIIYVYTRDKRYSELLESQQIGILFPDEANEEVQNTQSTLS